MRTVSRPKKLTQCMAAVCMVMGVALSGCNDSSSPSVTASKTSIAADSAIVGVQAIGFVDTDGAKLSAIDVEYKVDMTGADVNLDKYTITDYGIGLTPEIGTNPGVATKVYVKDSHHVIIEVNTDYQLGSVAGSYQAAMFAGVTQKGTITTNSNIITAGTTEVGNYHAAETRIFTPDGPVTVMANYANDGTFTIKGPEVFKLFTKEAGTAFHATECWEEATGLKVAVDLPYALYVPEDYNPAKKYALVLHIHDAGFLGDDPMITLTESQGPVNYASPEVQQIAKDQGLAGVIVVCPQINNSLRSTRDDYSVSAAVPATWQLMDYLTSHYSVDMNRIYGEGGSMGGMQVIAMAAQRDNYFAGLWPLGSQWGNNFNLDDENYNGAGKGYFEAPNDTGDEDSMIWSVDAHGNPVNYRNMYYLLSDDNILINNCKSDEFSTTVWTEFKYLYRDLAGAEIPYVSWNPLTTSKTDQDVVLNALVSEENDLGIYWAAFDGGNHMATWIYGHGVFEAYEWLLSQTRESEMDRDKLPLSGAFVRATDQLETAERALPNTDPTAYLVTGQYGAGTDGYNSANYKFNMTGILVKNLPGWLPAAP